MSKNNPSEAKLAVPTSGGFSGLKLPNSQVFVMIAAIIAIMLFFTRTADDAYLSTRSVSNLLRRTVITGILAVGMVFVTISVEIGLFVGSVMGLLGGVAAICDVWLGWPLSLTIVMTLVLGLFLGAWNGRRVAYRKVPLFTVIPTDMLAFRGIFIGIINDTTVSPTSAAMSQIGQSYLPASVGFTIDAFGPIVFAGQQWRRKMRRQVLGLQSPASTAVVGRRALAAIAVLSATWLSGDYRGVPIPVLLLTLLLPSGMFMTTQTAFGRRIYAIGGNLEVACLSRVSVERIKLAVFVINGLMVAIAGLILNSQFGASSPSAGNVAELDAVTAYVIGGTSLAGGVESAAGAVVGAFITASLDNDMNMMDVPIFWQYIVKGVIPLLAAWADSVTKRRSWFW